VKRRHIPRRGGGPWGRLLAVAVKLIARGTLGVACVQESAASCCATHEQLESAHSDETDPKEEEQTSTRAAKIKDLSFFY